MKPKAKAKCNKAIPPITTIYALINPITCTVFYVGATRRPLRVRLYGHLHDHEAIRGANLKKIKIINDIKAKGLLPLIQELEVCVGYLAPMYAERFWIYQYHVVFDHKLVNVLSRTYIDCLKRIKESKRSKNRVYW